MSDKQFERCSLEDATHVEVNGKVYLLGGNEVGLEYYHDECIGLRWVMEDAFIPKEIFTTFGIKTFKEIKREPKECMALTVLAQRNGKDVVALLPTDEFELGMTVRCVEILEEEK